jgi:integrase
VHGGCPVGLRRRVRCPLRSPGLSARRQQVSTAIAPGSRKRDGVGSTKSDRFRPVEIGRALSLLLRIHVARESAGFGRDELVLVMHASSRKHEPGRWPGRGDGAAMDRTTVSRDWHKAALTDAGVRDMPLRALRHTAAASWLAAGNSLIDVQRQLGHADISTTERYYRHLERRVSRPGQSRPRKQSLERTRRLIGRCEPRH